MINKKQFLLLSLLISHSKIYLKDNSNESIMELVQSNKSKKMVRKMMIMMNFQII